jgi:phage gp46-like protein
MNNGAPVETDSLQVPAYFRLKGKRAKWLYAPDTSWGSDFYTVKRRPDESGNQNLENVAIAAVQPLVDDGRALSVDANVVSVGANSAGLQISIVDASGQLQVTTFPGLGV